MHIFIVELETEDELLALEEHFVHLPDTFYRLHFFNEIADLFFDDWFEPNRILSHLERNARTFWEFDILVKFVSQIFQIIGLGA